MDLLELTHAAAVFGLFGLIWTIQLVHYPAFKYIEAPHWPRFHKFHSRNITFIVFPLMAGELVTAILLFLRDRSDSGFIFLVCASLSWFLTAVFFVPLHSKISVRPEASLLEKLVRWNWLRVLVWTLCASAVFVHLAQKFE